MGRILQSTDVRAALRSKQGGFIINPFRFVSGSGSIYNVPNNDAASAFASATNVVWDVTRGYYVNAATWGTGRNLLVPFSTALIKKITVNVTSYYNTPSSCLGIIWLNFTLDDSTGIVLGAVDAHADPTQGQTLYRGDAGIVSNTQTNAINQVWTYTVPGGRYINSPILFVGDYLSGYSGSNRGMKDITIEY